jgi:ribosomal protein S21
LGISKDRFCVKIYPINVIDETPSLKREDGRCFLIVPTIVKAKKDEPAASIIRRFKKQVMQDQILKDLKRKEFYIKPSQIRKEQKKEWERQKRREQRLSQSM